MKNRSLPAGRQAFTLIELLIVIAILGALASIVVINLVGGPAAARDTKRRAELKQYQTLLEIYANKNNGSYPSGNNIVATALCIPSKLGDVNCTDDPLAPDQHYRYRRSGSGLEYTLWTKLEKPQTTTYLVLCTDGRLLELSSVPGGGTCP